MDTQPFVQHQQPQQFSAGRSLPLSNFKGHPIPNHPDHLEGNNSGAKLKVSCTDLTQQKKQLLENNQGSNNQQYNKKNADAGPIIFLLKRQVKGLNEELNLSTDENKSLEQKMRGLETQKEKVKCNSQDQEEIFELKLKLKTSKENVTSLKDDNVHLRKKIVHLMCEVDTLQIRNRLFRERAESHHQNEGIEQLRSENQKLELELISERKENVQLKLQLDGESERVRQANVLAHDQNNLIRRLTLELAEHKVQLLKETNIKLEEKGATIRKLDEAIRVEHEQNPNKEEMVHLTKTVHELEMSNQKYNSENAESQKIIESLLNEKHELIGKLQNQHCSTQSSKLEELEHLVDKQRIKLKEATDEINALKSLTSSLDKKVEESNHIIHKQKIELENNEKYATELRLEWDKLQSEHKQLEGRNKTDKADRFREESPAKKARKWNYAHVNAHEDDDDHDFLWKMIRRPK